MSGYRMFTVFLYLFKVLYAVIMKEPEVYIGMPDQSSTLLELKFSLLHKGC
jgi:hypothetical protein